MAFQIHLLGFGSTKAAIQGEIDHYTKLLRPYASVSILSLKSPQGAFARKDELLEREENMLSGKWPRHAYLVALSEEGKMFDSLAFSRWLQKRVISQEPVVFTIGGAYGLSHGLKKRCNEIIILSSLTFPYRLCMVILLEQIYRAFTIVRGHPYHK